VLTFGLPLLLNRAGVGLVAEGSSDLGTAGVARASQGYKTRGLRSTMLGGEQTSEIDEVTGPLAHGRRKKTQQVQAADQTNEQQGGVNSWLVGCCRARATS
jgi:hypothetical protein